MGHRVKVLAATVALVVAAGCGLTGHDKDAAATQPSSGPIWDTESPSAEPTFDDLAAESPTPSPTPSRTSAKPKAAKKTKPTPTGPVNNFQHADCYHYDGKAVSKTAAKSALNAAAAKHYWPTSAPTLTVPSDLVRSVAWNESGWQSNIVNCDGGFGLMQLMPGTVDMINSRFEQSYDVKDYKQNAILGANYLAWLTKWMGDHYFKNDNYSLSTSKCSSTTSWCLLNAVIAGYHAGSGTVDAAAASKKLPSADYVNTVRSLMKSCFCDTY